ncbi:DUF6148 family protein [Leptospira sp. 96542]|nr:DUF6148 family protein [Leptospira sp. 96542]
MAGITLTQAQAQLDAWLAASLAVASGQAFEVSGRKLTRVNAEHIDRMIDYWGAKVANLSNSAAGRGRARTMVPGF